MPTVSRREAQIHAAIDPLEAELGRRPFQREIAEKVGLKSKGCVNKYLKRLEAKGLLERNYLGRDTLKVRRSPDAAQVLRNQSSAGSGAKQPDLLDGLQS